MKVSGSHAISAPRQDVWDALQDPAVLARTLPGCGALEVLGPNTYAATVTAGVASVKGTYQGRVELADIEAPRSYRLVASGAGSPGTVRAEAAVTLDETDGVTTVFYDADAVVGGMIGGVGQRMLSSVAKRTAAEFFTAVEQDLVRGPLEVPEHAAAPGAEPAAVGAGVGERGGELEVGQVFRSAAPPGRAPEDRRIAELAIAAIVGAAIALVGVLVGRRLGRQSGR